MSILASSAGKGDNARQRGTACSFACACRREDIDVAGRVAGYWLVLVRLRQGPRVSGHQMAASALCLLLSHLMLSIGLTWRLVRGCNMHTLMRLL